MDTTIYSLLKSVIDGKSILCDESMKNHTTFKIGGKADFLVLPQSTEQIKSLIQLLKMHNISYVVIGNGSNLLVSDEGIKGVVIKLGRNFSSVECRGNTIIAKSGVLLSRLANIALENSLTGLEFASGIPGTLGGATVMNAGAYGGEMKDVIVKTTYLDTEGEIHTVEGEEHCFGYRKSIFTESDIILEVVMSLKEGNKEEISKQMAELNGRRKEKQPLEFASAGSTFKRPEGHFAGKLIEDAGLRGYTIGGASVSSKHCGFVVSDGTATCEDVLLLIEYIQKTVYEKFSVMLEPEVRQIK